MSYPLLIFPQWPAAFFEWLFCSLDFKRYFYLINIKQLQSSPPPNISSNNTEDFVISESKFNNDVYYLSNTYYVLGFICWVAMQPNDLCIKSSIF